MSLDRAVAKDVHALRAAGATYAEISRLTGLSKSAIGSRLAAGVAKPGRHAGQQERKCLCCGKPFPSDGPMNRLCNACRGKSRTPFDIPHAVHYR